MALTNAYCSLADVKAALRIQDTLDDVLLETAINSASRLVDNYCNRYFYQGSTTSEIRYYATSDPYEVWIDDLVSLTALDTDNNGDKTYETSWTATDYELAPINGRSNGFYSPFTGIRAIGGQTFPVADLESCVRVTGRFGWSSVPDAIKQATIIQASRLFKRLESPLGVAGVSDIGIMRVTRSIDGDVAQLIDPFRQMRINA